MENMSNNCLNVGKRFEKLVSFQMGGSSLKRKTSIGSKSNNGFYGNKSYRGQQSQAKRRKISLEEVAKQYKKCFVKSSQCYLANEIDNEPPTIQKKHQEAVKKVPKQILEKDLDLSEDSSDEEDLAPGSLPILVGFNDKKDIQQSKNLPILKDHQKAKAKLPEQFLLEDLNLSEDSSDEEGEIFESTLVQQPLPTHSKSPNSENDVLRKMLAFDEVTKENEPFLGSIASLVRFIPKEDLISPIKDLPIPEEHQKANETVSRQLLLDLELSDDSSDEESDIFESTLAQKTKANLIALIENLPIQPKNPKPENNVSHQMSVNSSNLPEVSNKEEGPIFKSPIRVISPIKVLPISEKHQMVGEKFSHQVLLDDLDLSDSSDEEGEILDSTLTQQTKTNVVSPIKVQPIQSKYLKPENNVSHQMSLKSSNLPEVSSKEVKPIIGLFASPIRVYSPIPEKLRKAKGKFPFKILFGDLDLSGESSDDEDQTVKQPPAQQTKINNIPLKNIKSLVVAEKTIENKIDRSIEMSSDNKISTAKETTKATIIETTKAPTKATTNVTTKATIKAPIKAPTKATMKAVPTLKQPKESNQVSIAKNQKDEPRKMVIKPISPELLLTLIKKPNLTNEVKSCHKEPFKPINEEKKVIQQSVQKAEKFMEYPKTSNEGLKSNDIPQFQQSKFVSKIPSKTMVNIFPKTTVNSSKIAELKNRARMESTKAKKRPRDHSTSSTENVRETIQPYSKHLDNSRPNPSKIMIEIPLELIANSSNIIKPKREERKKICLKIKKNKMNNSYEINN